MAGFFNALMGPIQKQLDQTHKKEEDRRANQRVDLWRVIQDNNTSDEGREAAWGDLQKLSHPEAKTGIKKIQEIFGKIKPPATQQGQVQPAQQRSQSPPTSTPFQFYTNGPATRNDAPEFDPSNPDYKEGDVVQHQGQSGALVRGADGGWEMKVPNVHTRPVARGPVQAPPQSGVAQRPSPFMTATQIQQRTDAHLQSERDRRAKIADDQKLTPREKAIFVEHGTLPAQTRPTALGLRQQAESIAADPDADPSDIAAAKGYIASLAKPEKKVNTQAGLAMIPGQDDPVAIRTDPTQPGKAWDANTGELLAPGFKILDKTVLASNIKKSYYGEFGKYFQTGKARGLDDAAAKEYAAGIIEKETGLKFGRQEQQSAIDAALSGIGANTSPRSPDAPTAPKASAPGTLSPTPPRQSPAVQKPKSGAITPGQLSDEDNKNLNAYFGQLFGTTKGASKGSQVRVMAAQAALARLTGMNPMALNAALTEDKATAKALQEAVGVAGAFERVQETLKAHGQVLIDAAKAYGPGNVPLANKPIQWIQENAGSHPELQKYNLAIQAVQREYGRLIAGGVQSKAMLPVSASEKGEHVISKSATMKDIAAAVEQLQIEADTEQSAFQKQIAGLRGKLGSGVTGQAAGGNVTPPQPAAGAATHRFNPITGKIEEVKPNGK